MAFAALRLQLVLPVGHNSEVPKSRRLIGLDEVAAFAAVRLETRRRARNATLGRLWSRRVCVSFRGTLLGGHIKLALGVPGAADVPERKWTLNIVARGGEAMAALFNA